MSATEPRLRFVTGDVTDLEGSPRSPGAVFICHIANDVGKWGKGFTGALDARWGQPRMDYMDLWHRQQGRGRIPRGSALVSTVSKAPDAYVYTMVTQAGVGRGQDRVDYVELERCLAGLRAQVLPNDEVRMPRIGVGLAGGNWGIISQIIRQTLCENGVPVTVYDLPTLPEG